MVKRKKSYIKKINQLDTLSVHAGVKTDPLTGAVMTPCLLYTSPSPRD